MPKYPRASVFDRNPAYASRRASPVGDYGNSTALARELHRASLLATDARSIVKLPDALVQQWATRHPQVKAADPWAMAQLWLCQLRLGHSFPQSAIAEDEGDFFKLDASLGRAITAACALHRGDALVAHLGWLKRTDIRLGCKSVCAILRAVRAPVVTAQARVALMTLLLNVSCDAPCPAMPFTLAIVSLLRLAAVQLIRVDPLAMEAVLLHMCEHASLATALFAPTFFGHTDAGALPNVACFLWLACDAAPVYKDMETLTAIVHQTALAHSRGAADPHDWRRARQMMRIWACPGLRAAWCANDAISECLIRCAVDAGCREALDALWSNHDAPDEADAVARRSRAYRDAYRAWCARVASVEDVYSIASFVCGDRAAFDAACETVAQRMAPDSAPKCPITQDTVVFGARDARGFWFDAYAIRHWAACAGTNPLVPDEHLGPEQLALLNAADVMKAWHADAAPSALDAAVMRAQWPEWTQETTRLWASAP